MASKYAIETVFSLIDKITAPLGKVDRALGKIGVKSKTLSNALKRDFDKAAERVDNLGKSLKKLAGKAAFWGTAAVSAGFALVTKQFIEFDNALHSAGAIFSDLNPAADDFQSRLKSLGAEARNVAALTEFNAQQTASALATMAMAGIKSDQAVALLPKVADIATAAGVDIDRAVGMATGALNVFGKMTEDPTKLAENLQYVSDIMVKTANLATMDINMMYEAIGAGGGQFKRANQRIEDFAAAVDVLAANNITGAEAGNSINVMMTRLAAPAKKGQDAIAALGLQTRDAQNNLLNFVDIIDQLNVAFKGMGTAEQATYIDAIFGKNHYVAASYLIDAGREGLELYTKQLEEATGSTAQTAEVMRNSLQNRIEVLKSSLTELGFKFIDAFAEKGANAIKELTDKINNFDVTPLVNAAQSAISIIQFLGGIIVNAVKIAWQFRGVLLVIAGVLTIYHGALMVAALYTKTYTVVTGIAKTAIFLFTLVTKGQTAALTTLKIGTVGYTIASKAFTVVEGIKTAVTKGGTIAMNAATIAQWALNAAMNANPIGIIITLVGLLILAIVQLVKHWDEVAATMWRFGARIKEALMTPVLGFLELLSKIPGLGSIIDVEGARKAFQNEIDGFNRMADESEAKIILKREHELALSTGTIPLMPELPTDYDLSTMDIPELNIPELNLADYFTNYTEPEIPGDYSRLHGVVDILNGAVAPPLGETNTRTASSASGTSSVNSAPAVLEIISRNVTGIFAVLQKIDATITSISGKMPITFRADFSDNAVASPLRVTDTRTASSVGGTSSVNSAPAVLEIISRNVTGIFAVLQKTDAAVTGISSKMPITARAELPEIIQPDTATRNSLVLPRVNMSGGEEGAGDYYNPRNIAPITQAERVAYSFEERVNRLIIEVAAEKGTAARIVRAPRDAEIELVHSGGNA